MTVSELVTLLQNNSDGHDLNPPLNPLGWPLPWDIDLINDVISHTDASADMSLDRLQMFTSATCIVYKPFTNR